MDERVLVIPTEALHRAGLFQGFTPEAGRYLPPLLDPALMRFVPRGPAESDPSLKQLIPYAVLRHGGRVFHYGRAGGGEARLRSRRSVGLGGHINDTDGLAGPEAYRAGFLRELAEEADIAPGWTETVIGLINDDSTPVGQVHLGIVHLVELASPEVTLREAALVARGFDAVADLRREIEGFETWSRFLLEGEALCGGRGT
jgi:predicted NUDIX family phosphoesterase